MEYRIFGRTEQNIGVIGLGTEYLFKRLYKQSKENVVEVIGEAIDNGVNYIDLVFGVEDFLEDVAEGLKGRRNKVILAHHLGSGDKNGKYQKTRDVQKCEEIFDRALAIFDTDYMDVANIHYVRTMEEYDALTSSGQLLDMALRLKKEGKARYIGMSTHDPNVGMKAAKTGHFDMIMFQVNFANNAMLGRNEMLRTCAKERVAVVAMKVFAGGKLAHPNKISNFALHQTGGMRLKDKRTPKVITSTRCIHYTLSQPGVCTVVPGVKSMKELHDCLSYLKASDEEKDYSGLLKDFQEYVTGECLYCNHCLPCPADINIGQVLRLGDLARDGVTPEIKQEYNSLKFKATDCTKCGACEKRCPFDVKTVAKIKECALLFK
jgi:predicted aldo/keto reductase-like oxidoreductase